MKIRVPLACLVLLALASPPSRAATVIACQDINGSDYPVSPQHPCASQVVTTPAGTSDTTAQAVQGVTGGVPLATKAGTQTIVPLDVSTVTTGGTAVTALNAGHRSAGGWMQNPSTATILLCIAEIGTATGTSSAGSTTCIVPGQTYNLAASPNAVSVISSDSAHPFSGYGFQ